MDGFALRSADTTEAPVTLPVVARIAAGAPAGRPLAPGRRWDRDGGRRARRRGRGRPDRGGRGGSRRRHRLGGRRCRHDVRERGGDVKAGETVLDAGVLLGPGQVGALAAAGVAEVRATKRPRVGILVTGSELRQPGEALEAGQIYESNGLLLATALQLAGAVPAQLGVVADTEDEHRRTMERALLGFDMLVTTGARRSGRTISCARCRPSFGSRRSSGASP